MQGCRQGNNLRWAFDALHHSSRTNTILGLRAFGSPSLPLYFLYLHELSAGGHNSAIKIFLLTDKAFVGGFTPKSKAQTIRMGPPICSVLKLRTMATKVGRGSFLMGPTKLFYRSRSSERDGASYGLIK